MSNIWTFVFLCCNCFLFSKCEIPTLSVRKVDIKLIERKRQDTLEMCKLFNEDNGIIQTLSRVNNLDTNTKQRHRRLKREVESNTYSNPLLNNEDVNRIENIVDKIYDDMEENGQQITYRRRNLQTIKKNARNNTNRRFNFAPSLLLGPDNLLKQEEIVPTVTPVRIPWIKKWTFGIIPFFIDPNTYDSFLSDTIVKAFDYIEKATCIRMQRLRVKPTDEQSLKNVEWLYITNPSGIKQCVHSNEQKPNLGVQMVVFGYDCLSQGEIAHEVMHILGFSHEHTRLNRDQYLTINWENIKPGYKKYFEVRSDDLLSHLPYDYSSVLHYPPRAFSRNGQVTISVESNFKIGQREGLSEIDVEKIGMIFGYDCTLRNEDYLTKTCPRVIEKQNSEPENKKPKQTFKKYFENRIWPYGIVNYKIKDKMEFSTEERENIKAVISHIEKETCIEFKDITKEDDDDNDIKDTKEVTQTEVEQKASVETVPAKNVVNNDDESDDDSDTDDENSDHNDKLNEEVKVDDPSTVIEVNITMDKNDTKMKLTHAANLKFIKPTPSMSENEIQKDDTDDDNLRMQRKRNLRKSAKSARGKKENFKKQLKSPKKIVSPKRRHAGNVIVLARSAEPGCTCPPPGRTNGDKIVYINNDCFNSINDLLHLFVHLLGLDHQHNMYDRNHFIHIEWDKLTPDLKEEMQKTLPIEASVGFTYDYQSVMHYPWLQIKNGVTSIMYPVWNDGWAMGHWQGLSSIDVQKLNRIYADECQNRRNETYVN